ncbi:hypothetical protein HUJ04_006011 [Dendroctonus ponderosae]|nr:hypothetical protein HUJ04_006011 [Dendroctonus ponderosae]
MYCPNGTKNINRAPEQRNSYFVWAIGRKTRTKDKYRVVYTDHQRLQLEKEYSLNTRYINIKRKAEIALDLNLSERQVKIWFQNRRAKDRKLEKKQKEEQNRAMQSQPDREVPDGAGALREVSFNIALLNDNGIHPTTF